MAEGQAPGLRERKKERTRAQLIEVACEAVRARSPSEPPLVAILSALRR
ncbi:hypothetical protein WME79_44175 [Sorangium sp. So ce726]